MSSCVPRLDQCPARSHTHVSRRLSNGRTGSPGTGSPFTPGPSSNIPCVSVCVCVSMAILSLATKNTDRWGSPDLEEAKPCCGPRPPGALAGSWCNDMGTHFPHQEADQLCFLLPGHLLSLPSGLRGAIGLRLAGGRSPREPPGLRFRPEGCDSAGIRFGAWLPSQSKEAEAREAKPLPTIGRRGSGPRRRSAGSCPPLLATCSLQDGGSHHGGLLRSSRPGGETACQRARSHSLTHSNHLRSVLLVRSKQPGPAHTPGAGIPQGCAQQEGRPGGQRGCRAHADWLIRNLPPASPVPAELRARLRRVLLCCASLFPNGVYKKIIVVPFVLSSGNRVPRERPATGRRAGSPGGSVSGSDGGRGQRPPRPGLGAGGQSLERTRGCPSSGGGCAEKAAHVL